MHSPFGFVHCSDEKIATTKSYSVINLKKLCELLYTEKHIDDFESSLFFVILKLGKYSNFQGISIVQWDIDLYITILLKGQFYDY